jgi:NAD(P)-dependent dehydrogenase (short-subunit alcohol dehydrogenase family)
VSTLRGRVAVVTGASRGLGIGIALALGDAAVNCMAMGMAPELQPYQIAVVALAPGLVRTERVLAAFAGVGQLPDNLESPEYAGRAGAALASNSGVLTRSGAVLTAGQLATDSCRRQGLRSERDSRP